MEIFERLAGGDYEQVVLCQDSATGLRAIISVHDTTLGPALGGTRFYSYANDADAMDDVLRLSRGMTYKSAAAGLDLGGGKAVILGDPNRVKTEGLMRAYARFVDALGGRYITAEDVGTTQADMDLIRRETRYVTGVSRSLGGSGDPSAATAYGVLHGMKAVAEHLWGDRTLADKHIVVSGVGKVGYNLLRHLVEERARITVADVVPAAVERAVRDFGVDAVPVEKVHAVESDIYSPCALGKALNEDTIPELRCQAVVGSANNQLADDSCIERMTEAGVLYAPDYIVNAGGVINIAEEIVGYHRERAYSNIRRIYDTTKAVINTAQTDGISTTAAADRVAERRIAEIARVHQIRTFQHLGADR